MHTAKRFVINPSGGGKNQSHKLLNDDLNVKHPYILQFGNRVSCT